MTLEEINRMPLDEFVGQIGPVFEHSPWIAEKTWQERPFASVEQLHGKLCRTVRGARPEQQVELIRAHPDLVGKAARAGTLTAASTAEQASAGLDRLSAEEIKLFESYNEQYRNKFGFPFVICARLNKKEAILAAFPQRLANGPQQEIKTALDEIYKIALLRLRAIVGA